MDAAFEAERAWAEPRGKAVTPPPRQNDEVEFSPASVASSPNEVQETDDTEGACVNTTRDVITILQGGTWKQETEYSRVLSAAAVCATAAYGDLLEQIRQYLEVGHGLSRSVSRSVCICLSVCWSGSQSVSL
eukprot:GHVU01162935.1.p1 GENE.GHVU01162935.1~~GHVU01162935.1.p1  ORF type:complete len:132 (+),score=7.95 GHVU01162935.1:432-827(+)